MIKSFVGVEAATNPTIFEDLFRLRHEIYIVRRKWGALRHEGGLEKDSYDNSDAIYLIGLSAKAPHAREFGPWQTNRDGSEIRYRARWPGQS